MITRRPGTPPVGRHLAALALLGIGLVVRPPRADATVDHREELVGVSPDGEHYLKAVGGVAHVERIERCRFLDRRCVTIHTMTFLPGTDEYPLFKDRDRWWPTLPALRRIPLLRKGLVEARRHRGLLLEARNLARSSEYALVARCGRGLLLRKDRDYTDSHPVVRRTWWDPRLRFVLIELLENQNTVLLGAVIPAALRAPRCLTGAAPGPRRPRSGPGRLTDTPRGDAARTRRRPTAPSRPCPGGSSPA